MPEEALEVVRAWGFSLTTMKRFTWHKLTKHGKSLGMGHWMRANTEGLPLQFIEAPRGRHSAKPGEVRERLVRLMGDVPRIEVFAREAIAGWDVWGNEVESTIGLKNKRVVRQGPFSGAHEVPPRS